ncbi:hypothetical protein HpCK38_17370 [Helicobacter pylori]
MRKHKNIYKEHIEKFEKMLILMSAFLIIASIYLIVSGHILNGVTTLANTLFWSGYYLGKRSEIQKFIEKVELKGENSN